MSYVRSIQDIEANALTLLEAIHLPTDERDIGIKLVKAGRVFFPIEYNGLLAFVPSKFVGYRNNRVAQHVTKRNNRDGRDTNREIARIVGRPTPDPDLERRLEAYCISIGTELENHKHSFWAMPGRRDSTAPLGSAINDLLPDGIGNDSPEYRRRMGGTYVRDDKVRREVLRRANGHCEFRGCKPFNNRRGEAYLETHHIISLSEQGVDKPSNVIALCPNHHREAHFGENWQSLQDKFIDILKRDR